MQATDRRYNQYNNFWVENYIENYIEPLPGTSSNPKNQWQMPHDKEFQTIKNFSSDCTEICSQQGFWKLEGTPKWMV